MDVDRMLKDNNKPQHKNSNTNLGLIINFSYLRNNVY